MADVAAWVTAIATAGTVAAVLGVDWLRRREEARKRPLRIRDLQRRIEARDEELVDRLAAADQAEAANREAVMADFGERNMTASSVYQTAQERVRSDADRARDQLRREHRLERDRLADELRALGGQDPEREP